MGALTTALFVTYMLTAPFTGWLGDRFRRKPLIVAGVVLWSLATLVTYFVHDYWSLYFRHALVGEWARRPSGSLRRRCCLISFRRGSGTGFCRSSTWRFRWARRWGTWWVDSSASALMADAVFRWRDSGAADCRGVCVVCDGATARRQ